MNYLSLRIGGGMKVPNNKNNLKAGIIGCGRIAGDFEDDPTWLWKPCTHAGVLSSMEDVEITAVCDSDYKKVEAFAERWKVPAFYNRVEDFLEHGYFDMISICTPPETHCYITVMAAARSPRVIFCEKPIALAINEAEKMVQTCREAGIHLVINHNKRWHPIVRKVKDIVASGVVGAPIAIVCRYTSGLEVVGTHLIDLLLNFAGETAPSHIFSLNEKTDIEKLWYSENYSTSDPAYSGVVLFDNGIIGFLIGSCMKDYPHFAIEIDCSDGQIQLLNNCMDLYVGQTKNNLLFGGAKRLAVEKYDVNIEKSEMWYAIEENMGLCNGEINKSSSSGKNALSVVRLIEQMKKNSVVFERLYY